MIASSVSSRKVSFYKSLEYRFLIEAKKIEIKTRNMSDAKVRKALERDGIKPLRVEIPDELQPGNQGLTWTVFIGYPE